MVNLLSVVRTIWMSNIDKVQHWLNRLPNKKKKHWVNQSVASSRSLRVCNLENSLVRENPSENEDFSLKSSQIRKSQ